MNRYHYLLFILPLFLMSCATVEKDVRISLRDAESKSPVDNGILIFDRPNLSSWYFSMDPIRSPKYIIGTMGSVEIDELKDAVWSMKAEVKGYDRAVSVYSLSELLQLGPEDWRKMGNQRSEHPNFPGKQLEFRVETLNR